MTGYILLAVWTLAFMAGAYLYGIKVGYRAGAEDGHELAIQRLQ